MRISLRILIVYFSILLQTTLAVKLEIFGIIPNLVLIALFYFQFYSHPEEMIHIAFWAGIALDSFSIHYFGVNGFCFVVSSFVMYYINQRLFIDDILSKILLNSFAVFLYNVLYYLIINGNQLFIFPHDFFAIGFPSFLYTSILSSLVLLISLIRR